MMIIEPGKQNKAVLRHIKRIPISTKRGISKAFLEIGPDVIQNAQEFMQRPKTGVVRTVYWSTAGRRLKKGRRHRASAKGEPPAIVSGELFRSMGFNRNTFTHLEIGSKADHSQWLEPSPDGSWSGYLDRPFLRNAIRKSNRNIQTYLSQYINDAIVMDYKG